MKIGWPALLGASVLAIACKKTGPASVRLSNNSAMLAIPAATLRMGCDSGRDAHCSATEQPQHAVSVESFQIDRTEVTQDQYAGCIDSGKCTAPSTGFDPAKRPRKPVTHVTWGQARAFCAWRSARLPTEAEWELAARGTDGRIYPWGDAPPSCDKPYTNDCGTGPSDVGERAGGASPFGVLDMAGNVEEWVEDQYRPYADPQGPGSSAGERVARGGAYDAWHSRATARSAVQPDYQDGLLGFRCAASGKTGFIEGGS